MSLSRNFQSNILKHQLWSPADHLLVAVSGGVDSMVLFDLLTHLPESYKPQSIGIAHINHHTRPETDQEEAAVRQVAKANDCPIYVKNWEQGAQIDQAFEQKARDMRYNFFHQVMKDYGYTVLITAHHQDDQAETVLMKLIRGGLLEEKLGMVFKRRFYVGHLVRPLLNVSKADLYYYAKENSVLYFEDSSNKTNHYMRNRIRNEVIPQLELENSQAQKHLAEFSNDLSDLIQVAQPYVHKLKREIAEVDLSDNKGLVDLQAFNKHNHASQRLILTSLFKDLFRDNKGFKKAYVETILNWLESDSPNSSLTLADGWLCRRDYDRLIISKEQVPQTDSTARFTLGMNEWVSLNDQEQIGLFDLNAVRLGPKDLMMSMPKEDLKPPFTIRHRQAGDRMTYKGGKGTKKIKDIFINKKVPKIMRDQAWIVQDSQEEILWLVGFQESQLSNDLITDKINYIFVYRQND